MPPRAPALRPRGWAFSPLGFLRRVFLGGYEDNIPFLASGLTFDALLWILPLLAVVLSGFGYAVGGADEPRALARVITAWVLPDAGGGSTPFATVAAALEELADSRTQLTLWGVPFFVWFSWRLFGSIRAALNDVFDTEETRAWWVGKAVDLSLGVLSAVLILTNTVITLVVLRAPWAGRFLAGLLAYVAVTVLFYVVYMFAPSRPMRWDTALVAALFASLGFEIAKRLYGIYLIQFATVDRLLSNTNALALLLFVLWIYATALLFLAGGELAETYDLARRQREQRAVLG
ncbi:MAG TPA: YihY/virulence factor BrkB family protein [Gemmatimonadales bacterium]